MTIESWNALMLKRAIELGKVHETGQTFDGKKCVQVDWDLWHHYFSIVVDIVIRVSDIIANMNQQMQCDVQLVRGKLWEGIRTTAGQYPQGAENLKALDCQEARVKAWVSDMKVRTRGSQTSFQSKATGVTPHNEKAASVIIALEELRILVVGYSQEEQRELIAEIEEYAAQMFDWLDPGGKAIAALELSKTGLEQYGKAYAANLIDVALSSMFNVMINLTPVDECDHLALPILKGLKEWKIQPMIMAIFKGLQQSRSKTACEELAAEIDASMAGELRVTKPLPKGHPGEAMVLKHDMQLAHWRTGLKDGAKDIELEKREQKQKDQKTKWAAESEKLDPHAFSYKVSEFQKGRKYKAAHHQTEKLMQQVRNKSLKKVIAKSSTLKLKIAQENDIRELAQKAKKKVGVPIQFEMDAGSQSQHMCVCA